MSDVRARKKRMGRIVRYLKGAYPKPKSELRYNTPFQFLVAVALSAQCTDKVVNKVTESLFEKYKTVRDFSFSNSQEFENEISSVTFFRNKAKHIRATATIVADDYGGAVPCDENALQQLPGIGYKTAHVIVGELFDYWPGIPTDTHVKRFARKFDLTKHADLKKISKDIEALASKKDWKYINNGLVLYGRYICKARRHECGEHPLTRLWPEAMNRWPKAG